MMPIYDTNVDLCGLFPDGQLALDKPSDIGHLCLETMLRDK